MAIKWGIINFEPSIKQILVGIDNSDVVLLDGFKKGAYHIVDPNQGKYWVSASTFEKSYIYKKFAVAVQP